MAIDTRDERAGAQGTHWIPVYPLGDGSIGQADRQQSAGVYPGILAPSASAVRVPWFLFFSQEA